ncbi:glycosyltransferase [Neoroseomonas oryzicola]|uniref:Glycosyltransferase family 1 protein n=1 Tax=Neoroseomonas oryzicola TaxID=535904 RepID=A0A9X9WFS4_9PROT|nr:glycosyltransferase [Neoroseomonas oryzicola]MBR0659184.1 glycosyltransferase family 1 protein [Neoroseomonas oryzicola]NKE17756.1 glycosyltransferase family 1 protein [Neoroseomonas oryzicola]
MAEFLVTTFEGGGNVPPVLGMIRRLVARGHRVRLLSDAVLREEAEAAGASFRAWTTAPSRPDRRPESDPLEDWAATEPGGGLLRLLDRMTIGPAAAHAADTLAELRRAPADALVCSDLMFGPTIGAEAAGVPFATFASNIAVVPIEGIPPRGPGLAPPATEAERELAAGVAAWFHTMLDERLPVLNAARATVGLAPLAETIEQPRRAAMTLLATSTAFDFPATSLPPGLRYVGPLLDAPDWAAAWESPWDAQDARPLVLVALSTTFQDQVGTIQRLLDAMESLAVRAVVTLGPALDGVALRVPGNAHVVASASHDALMREAALVVTHCGHGTVMRALAHRRPMLCLPMGRDQNDNAARVAARGAGIRLAPDADAAALRDAIATLLADPCYAAAAAALGTAIAATTREEALVEALEELVAGPACRHAA